jgi:ADP-dependent NAD(P)H-hydrate dehydratase
MTNVPQDVTATPLPRLPERRPESHKGDYGRALLVGGSRDMSGAIALAGMATLRSGAGLVTLAVPRAIQDVVARIEPSYMTHGLADDGAHLGPAAADEVLAMAGPQSAIALGPGLGRGDGLTQFVVRLYGDIAQPMVVDADALFALAQRPESLTKPGGPRVLTPHAGEFARLAGLPMDEAKTLADADDARRSQAAAELAGRDSTGRTIVLLKGHRTVVADGRRASINHTGNPGMATGGTGDALTGIITGLLSQSLSPWDAARLGAYVHGLAGDLAAADLGEVSLIASDLVKYLPAAFQQLDK